MAPDAMTGCLAQLRGGGFVLVLDTAVDPPEAVLACAASRITPDAVSFLVSAVAVIAIGRHFHPHEKTRTASLGLSTVLADMGETIDELVTELTPTAQRLGCEAEARHALAIVKNGPSYLRQRDVVASGGTLVDVVDSLVEELRTDRPRVVETVDPTETHRPRG